MHVLSFLGNQLYSTHYLLLSVLKSSSFQRLVLLASNPFLIAILFHTFLAKPKRIMGVINIIAQSRRCEKQRFSNLRFCYFNVLLFHVVFGVCCYALCCFV